MLVSAYCVADLALISLRPLFLSSSPQLFYAPANSHGQKNSSVAKYMPVWDFNIFHNGDIPPSLSAKVVHAPQNKIPVLSRLPLQLNGLVIYQDPAYSLASITIKSQNKSGAYRVGDKVGDMANITRIEEKRVYFINLSANAEEYMELPAVPSISSHIPSPAEKGKGRKAESYIRTVGDFQFELNRSDVNKRLRSLPDILQEAKVVPHWENGKLAGWRFEYIKQGSVYDHFGLKKSDIVTSVAGELPPSQIQAVELFHKLKNQSKITATVKRKGKEFPFSWSIKEDVSIESPPVSRFY